MFPTQHREHFYVKNVIKILNIVNKYVYMSVNAGNIKNYV